MTHKPENPVRNQNIDLQPAVPARTPPITGPRARLSWRTGNCISALPNRVTGSMDRTPTTGEPPNISPALVWRRNVRNDASTECNRTRATGCLQGTEREEHRTVLGQGQSDVGPNIEKEGIDQRHPTTLAIGQWGPKGRAKTLSNHICCDGQIDDFR